jgi:hypothetical protein
MKIENKYEILNDYVKLIITSPKYGIFEFIIDNDEYEKVRQYHWSIFRTHNVYNTSEFFYASTTDKRLPSTHRLLHRLINQTEKGLITDHIDGNTLNTRKENLRSCTYQENGMNKPLPASSTSGFKGVTWVKRQNKWMAHLEYKQKFHNLGYFNNIEDAITVRKKAETKYFGEFNRSEEFL